ncbi:MAG: peptidylprolyl isomerase [Euryarchaeota archaeon]|nr:peptidylprolyl isomerase [Euryarchaeota archaeon]
MVFSTPLGSFKAEIFQEQVPITASNFLNLARSGLYNGTLFHRVIKGFVIQGGDPLSKDGDPSNDGFGGSGTEIPDEFHPDLFHDQEGVLSMANSGPDTGSSQFFVTLAPAPQLDDRHSVFGRVCSGLDIVRRIGNLTTDPATQRPKSPPAMNLTVSFPGAPTGYVVKRELSSRPYVDEAIRGGSHRVNVSGVNETDIRYCAPRGENDTTLCPRAMRWPIAVKNTGNVRTVANVTIDFPEGFFTFVAEDNVGDPGGPPVESLTNTSTISFEVPAGQLHTIIVQAFADLRNITEGYYTATVTVTAREDPAVTGRIPLPFQLGGLGAALDQRSRVAFDYVIYLPNGLLVDTSIERIAKDTAIPKFTQGFQLRDSYSAVAMSIDGQTPVPQIYAPIAANIAGFLVNETAVYQLEAIDAYGIFKPQRPEVMQGLRVAFVVIIREKLVESGP